MAAFTYHLTYVPRSSCDIRPHFSPILISEVFKLKVEIQKRTITYLSYAEEVLKEITRPRTVPSTVNKAFEIESLCFVFSDTKETTMKGNKVRKQTTG